MDFDVKLIEADWDEEYGISTLHLSYVLQTLLPVHVVKWDSTKKHYLHIKSTLESSQDEIASFIVTGSMSEGYMIPPSIQRIRKKGEVPDAEVLSDVDTLWVASQMLVWTREEPNEEDKHYKGYFEYSKESPGYVRICLPSTREKDETFVREEATGKWYLSGTKFTDKMFDAISDRGDVTKQGPAISMIDPLIANTGTVFRIKDGISKDLVLALPCHPWPSIADAWGERVKGSPWVKPDVADAIIKDGCHVVGVPSKTTRTPDIEWRLSFSASEGQIARQSVTDYQRQCFIYVKILHYQKIKPKGIISSYVFKSVFLHCCEKLPVSVWRDRPGSCVLFILDVVLYCLRKKHVPTYFLPENNLIRHLSDEEVSATIAAVLEVRRDPITPVLEFTDTRLFPHHCVLITYREMIEPLLTDMQEFKNHQSKETSVLKGIIPTGFKICHFLMAETSSNEEAALFKHQEGIRCLIGIYTYWLQLMDLDATLAQYIEQAGLTLVEPKLKLVYFDTVISLETEYPEFSSLKPNVARLFHRLSSSEGITADMKRGYITKAGNLYRSLYDENNENHVVMYTNFLLTQKRFSEARVLLEDYLRKHTTTSAECTFDHSDQDYLIEPLRSHIEAHGSITANAYAFILFFLVICLRSDSATNDPNIVQPVLDKLDDHYKKKKDENTLRLNNLAKSFEGNNEAKWPYVGYLYSNCSIL